MAHLKDPTRGAIVNLIDAACERLTALIPEMAAYSSVQTEADTRLVERPGPPGSFAAATSRPTSKES